MKVVSRFRTTSEQLPTLQFTCDGEIVHARQGDTIAAALLAHSSAATRWTAKNTPRTPYCMMGVCFDCLVEIDGQQNVQSCMVQVQEGMQVRRQTGLRILGSGGQNV